MKRARFATLFTASLFCLSVPSAQSSPHAVNPPRADESALVSPFASTVEGLNIPNAHVVGRRDGEVIRGMAPKSKIPELVAHGVTDIVIFKDELKGDVSAEIALLKQNGYTPDRIHAIPFRWRDIPGFRGACEQMIDALQILETAYRTPGRSAFFHCTVGEDRTGMLAALFKMIEMPEEGWSTRKAFDDEMCMHGYEAGNPQKPEFVVDIIRREMTPIFLKLATLVDTGTIAAGKLDRSVCAQDVRAHYELSDYACKASPLFTFGVNKL